MPGPGAQGVETDEGCDNEVGTRGWVGPKGREQAEAEAKGGWKTRRLGFEGGSGKLGWREGWEKEPGPTK